VDSEIVYDGLKAGLKPGPHVVGLPAGDDVPYTVTDDAARPSPAPASPWQPPDGVRVVKVTPDTTRITLASNTWFIPANDAAKVKIASNDTIITSPDGVRNCVACGIDLVCTSAERDAIRIVADNLDGITFDSCSITGGKNNIVIQGWHIEGPPTIYNVEFTDCRFLDPLGNVDRTGQNVFAANIDGLTFTKPVCINAGFKHKIRSIYTHGFYIQTGCRRVTITKPFVANAESVGVQARGNNSDTDPGPVVTGGVYYGCPISGMLNGKRATFSGNACVVWPHHKAVNTGGECGMYGSVGRFVLEDNVLVMGPRTDAGQDLEAWRNAPRSDSWARREACAYESNKNNVVRKDVSVNLDDLVLRARNGEDVVDEAQARVRGAVK
jgi:hypothetical protein